jgi:segregation and condensation protein B
MNTYDPKHLRLIEAILFASADPISEKALANHMPEGVDVTMLLKDLQAMYADRGVTLNRAGSTWAFLAQLMNVELKVPRKLSRAAVETLVIIAYHQPVTRAEIEEIRGVGLSRGTLDVLLELGWIRPRGRKKVPGRPVTWGTADAFLDHFGIENVGDLPGMDELKAAGLLDAGPAISAFQGKMGKDGEQDAEDSDQGQMALIEGGDDDPEAIKEMLEPLDTEEGDAERP